MCRNGTTSDFGQNRFCCLGKKSVSPDPLNEGMTDYKQNLLECIRNTTCYQDLLPLLSIVPFQLIQSAVYDYVQNIMTPDAINTGYFNHMSMERIIPTDIISNTLSYLPLSQIRSLSLISHTFNTACNNVLKRKKMVLTIVKKRVQSQPMFQLSPETTTCPYTSILVNYNELLSNIKVIQFIKKNWNKLIYISMLEKRSRNCFIDFDGILTSLKLKLHPNLSAIMFKNDLGVQKRYFNPHSLDFLQFAINLEYISIPFRIPEIWNILVKNCPKLHCLSLRVEKGSFDGRLLKKRYRIKYNYGDYQDKLLIANNLWSLTIYTKNDFTYFAKDFIKSMLRSSPNLYRLCINIDIYILDEMQFSIPTKNLVSLTIGSSVKIGKYCGEFIQNCLKLRYLELPWDIKPIDEYNEHISKMLSIFINYNGKTNIIYLGVTWMVVDRFTESINAATYDYTNFPQPIDHVFSNFNKILINDYKCNKENIKNCRVLVSTSLEEYQVEDAKKFSTDSLGLRENCCILKPENVILMTVLENVSNDKEFYDFCQRLMKIINGVN